MTPEQKAKAFSESKKVLDWTKGDPIAEAWLDGHYAKAESYIADATIKGLEDKANRLLEVIRLQQEEKKSDQAFIRKLLHGIQCQRCELEVKQIILDAHTAPRIDVEKVKSENGEG